MKLPLITKTSSPPLCKLTFPNEAAKAAVILLVILAAACRSVLADPVSSLVVNGAVTAPATWTIAQLMKNPLIPLQMVHYTRDGAAHTADCVALLAVVQAAQPQINPHIKNHRLQFMIAVLGFDGYTVDFSYAELLPQFGNHSVWLALDEDGKPLAGESGPAQLLVPDDVKPGCWVHGVAAITVIDGAEIGSSAKG